MLDITRSRNRAENIPGSIKGVRNDLSPTHLGEIHRFEIIPAVFSYSTVDR